MSLNHLPEQEQIRRNSLEEIRKLGIDPYPAEGYEINTSSKEILENFDPDKENFQVVSLAGRIMSRRIMGNASFIEIQDSAGKIQVYFRRDTICPDEDKTQYNTLFKKLLDIGDIIGVKGNVFKTQVGEISVNVNQFTLLSKSIRPLPIVKEKGDKTFDAFTDPEQRYRNRSMDLVVNPHIKDVFIKRSKIIQSIRTFLNNKEYLEVETPVLQPVYGGAAARPFKTHHNALDQTLYLRIADELYLKRIIVGGFDGVYEFAKDFRNEGMDRFHNPEFSMMEIYVAYKDYYWMMDLFEEMIEKVTLDLHGTTKIQVGEKRIDFKRPWKRLTMFEAIKEFTGVDISEMDERELVKTAKKLKVEVDETMGKGKLIDEIFGETTEPKLIQPTYIIDYPVEMSPLSKKHRSKEGLVERFEAIVNGKELCNAFSELNDPIDQRERFEHQLQLGKKGDEEAMVMDEAFLNAVELGMPPMAGLGVGIDRLTMLMTDSNSIQDVIFFPQMRQEASQQSAVDSPQEYVELGIPEEWVEVLKQLGFTTVEKLKEVEKPGKLANDLNGYNKKNKLGLKGLSPEVVGEWLTAITPKSDIPSQKIDKESEPVKRQPKRTFDTQKREHNEGWIIKQAEELLEFAEVQKNSSKILYAALEMRNALELTNYSVIKMSIPIEEHETLDEIIKGPHGIQKANSKYKILKFKHQSFVHEIIQMYEYHDYKEFDFNISDELKSRLAHYVHSSTNNQSDFEFNSKYMQDAIALINESINFLKKFYTIKGNQYEYLGFNFSNLDDRLMKVYKDWRENPSQNKEDIYERLVDTYKDNQKDTN